MSGSEPDEVVVTMNDDNASTSSNVAKKKTTLSAQAQSRMSVLSTACKKHEFVPFTKDGHTLFVKFDIDMEEKANTGSVAVFVIRLLIEGNTGKTRLNYGSVTRRIISHLLAAVTISFPAS